MGFANQNTQQKFPFTYDEVFNGIIAVMPSIGFKLQSQDQTLGRITASAGMSLFSWGENLTLIVEKVDTKITNVGIESALKMGMNFAGAHRHTKNFNKIIGALSAYLQKGSRAL